MRGASRYRELLNQSDTGFIELRVSFRIRSSLRDIAANSGKVRIRDTKVLLLTRFIYANECPTSLENSLT
jgi:hypothetical protein